MHSTVGLILCFNSVGLVVKSTHSPHYLTSDTFYLKNIPIFWIADTHLPIVPCFVAFYMLWSPHLAINQNAATKHWKRTTASSVVIGVIGINLFFYYSLLMILIVLHGFNSSGDEASVKIRSTLVTFVLFYDLFNKVSRHVWLVLLLDSVCRSQLITVVQNAVG